MPSPARIRNRPTLFGALQGRTHDGRKYRMLNTVDEFTRECLAMRVARRLKSVDVIELLAELFILRGAPRYIRSDNGPEFIAEAVQGWIAALGARTAYITLGSPWENGYVESFNARLRDELMNGDIFYTLREAQVVIESWRRHYNRVRLNASLGYRAPSSEVVVPRGIGCSGQPGSPSVCGHTGVLSRPVRYSLEPALNMN